MRNSIRNRLTIAFIALTVGLLVMVGAVLAWQSYVTQQTQAINLQSALSQRIAVEVTAYMQTQENALREVIQVQGLGKLDDNQQTQMLSELISNTDTFDKLTLINSYGREQIVVSRTEVSTKLNDLSKTDEFTIPKSDGLVYYGPVQFSATTGEPFVVIGMPIVDVRSGTVTGVLAADVRFKPVWDLLATISLGKGSNAYIVDAQNRVVAHNNPSIVLRNTLFTVPAKNGVYNGVSGTNVVLAADHIAFGKQNFTVVAETPTSEAFASIINTELTIVLLLFFAIVVAGVLGWFVARQIVLPLEALVGTAQLISTGDLSQQARVTSNDEIGTLATAFNSMTARLREFIGTLESRVAERTQSLELAAKVGRTVSQVRTLDVLLKDATELIRSQFDLYYVQVYLTDTSMTNLVLQSGTGSVGAELLGRAHRLPLNIGSINGRAAIEKHSVVVSDTAASATFRPNPLLPETRSEMAVPLLVGEKVVGVLDLQSTQAGTLSQEILPAFEALAGQLAIAIQNANLLAETEEARAEVEKQASRLVRANWQDYMDAIHQPEQIGFRFEQNKLSSFDGVYEVRDNDLTAPITVTGEPLGTLVVEVDKEKQNPQTTELVNTVARQVAQQIESLRLLGSAERYRSEAEQAAHRLTREGWKGYLDSKGGGQLGYLYDLKEVVPVNGTSKLDDHAFSLPIKVQDETVGKLAILELDPNDKAAIELVNLVAERLGAHLEGLRLSEQIEKRAYELATIASVSTTASSTLDPGQLLQAVADLTKESFSFYHAHIYLLDQAGNALQLTAGAGAVGKQMVAEGHSIPLDREQSLVARAARSREGFFVNDVRSEPDFLPNPLLPETRSELAVPMIVGDKVIGVFDVQANTINRFTVDDIRIQTTLASQISVAVQNARTFAQAQRQAERETTLNLISQKIQGATTVEAALQIAARELGHALGAPLTIAQLGLKDRNNGGEKQPA